MCGKFFAHLALKSALGALVLAAPAGDLRGEETNCNVRPPGLVNISTRLQSAAGDRSLFGGFIITGTAPKRVLIRALGPSLGLSGILPDPVLYLLDSRGNEIGYNNSWRQDEQAVQATGIPPSDDREAALVVALAPGFYTARVDDIQTRTGIALVEIYDLGTIGSDDPGAARLAELSSRGWVKTGDNVMFGGFIIEGETTRVIVRAIGPSLPPFTGNVNNLADPTLELYNSDGSLITSNDDWRSDQEQAITETGVPPSDDRESAIVAVLNPGNYTSIVRGKNGQTGIGVVEVYDLTHR